MQIKRETNSSPWLFWLIIKCQESTKLHARHRQDRLSRFFELAHNLRPDKTKRSPSLKRVSLTIPSLPLPINSFPVVVVGLSLLFLRAASTKRFYFYAMTETESGRSGWKKKIIPTHPLTPPRRSSQARARSTWSKFLNLCTELDI